MQQCASEFLRYYILLPKIKLTQITAIKGYLEVLSSSLQNLTHEQREVLKEPLGKTQKSTQRLEDLIEKLLQISTMEKSEKLPVVIPKVEEG